VSYLRAVVPPKAYKHRTLAAARPSAYALSDRELGRAGMVTVYIARDPKRARNPMESNRQ